MRSIRQSFKAQPTSKSSNQTENFPKKSNLKVKRSQIFVWGATRRNLQARPKILKKIIGTSNQPIKRK
jgi:hypothetical protein